MDVIVWTSDADVAQVLAHVASEGGIVPRVAGTDAPLPEGALGAELVFLDLRVGRGPMSVPAPIVADRMVALVDSAESAANALDVGFERLLRWPASRERIGGLFERATRVAVRPSLRALLESIPDGVVIHAGDGRILHANPRFLSLVDVERLDELVGTPVLSWLHPDDRPTVEERMRFVHSGRGPTPPRVMRFVQKRGACVEAECRAMAYPPGGPGAVLVVARDLSEVRAAEDALARSEQQFRRLLEDLHVGVVLHGPDGEARVFNRAALDLLGIEAHQLLGRRALPAEWTVVREDGTPVSAQDQPTAVVMRTRTPVHGAVVGVLRPGTRERIWLLVHVEPHFDEKGTIVQLVSTFGDITERRKLDARLLATDRLASMGRLAAGVAHEINNPLTYVIGGLQLLAGQIETTPGLREDVRPFLVKNVARALDGAERVRVIVSDLRKLSRDEETLGPVDLKRVVASSVQLASRTVASRARLACELNDVPLVAGTEARLGQIVLNLLLNAAEAIPDGDPSREEVRVETRTDPDGSAVLEVHDTGSGIPEDARDHVFEPFFTTKPVGVGTGLGLSICHGIVSQLGGEITVAPRLERGTTFRVRIPAYRGNARIVANLASAETPVPCDARWRVLLVDDDPDVRETVGELLSERHDVELVGDPRTALERVRSGERYDVVLCDVVMPGLSGLDVYDTLVSLEPELAARTVFMSGGTVTERAERFRERMIDRWLAKPFSLGRFESVVRKLLHVRRMGEVT